MIDKLKADFENYDPDKDYSGAIGMKLAERAMKRFNGDTKKIAEWFSKGRVSLERKLAQDLEDSESNPKINREEIYKLFLQDAEDIESYATKLMGKCLEKYFPEYREGGKKQLKHYKRLIEVKKEFLKKRQYARRVVNSNKR